jgi:D-alanyl-D-alanine carboxypeptidase
MDIATPPRATIAAGRPRLLRAITATMRWRHCGAAGRAVLFAALALGGALTLAPGAARAAPHAALVMDARTGEVVYSRDADKRLHPASLTKMMTLYLTMEAVKTGRLRLDQRVTISAKAARQPASKIGLKAGSRVSVRDLIRAAAVKSANDAAMALAEAVGGSQDGFARMMTQKARALGMADTNFRNPSGLTQSGHLSTARDMATLGRRLFFDHPAYYNLFSRQTAQTMGKTVRNTNRRLLASYRGADGIKTGYTQKAGFNLVASAHRGNKRVIAVVFGGRSSRARNAEVARLLDLGFDLVPENAPMIKPGLARVLVSTAPLPIDKPAAPETIADLVLEALGPSAAKASERARMSRSAFAPRRSDVPRSRPAPREIGVAMRVEYPTPRPR